MGFDNSDHLVYIMWEDVIGSFSGGQAQVSEAPPLKNPLVLLAIYAVLPE